MDKRLEDYLAEVAEQLHPLPVARRNEELREMRQHPLNAVTVNREMGQSEDEAAASAVEQCGPPEEATQGLIRAWRRSKALNKRDFWCAAACTLALWFLLPDLAIRLSNPCAGALQSQVFGDLTSYPRLHHLSGLVSIMILCLPAWILMGGLSGLLFPKRATAGTAMVMAVCLVHLGIVIGQRICSEFVARHNYIVDEPFYLLTDFAQYVLLSVVTVSAAWGGSRWRKMPSVQGRRVWG